MVFQASTRRSMLWWGSQLRACRNDHPAEPQNHLYCISFNLHSTEYNWPILHVISITQMTGIILEELSIESCYHRQRLLHDSSKNLISLFEESLKYMHAYMSWTPFDWNGPKLEKSSASKNKISAKCCHVHLSSDTTAASQPHAVLSDFLLIQKHLIRFKWAFCCCVSMSLQSVPDRRWCVVIKSLVLLIGPRAGTQTWGCCSRTKPLYMGRWANGCPETMEL